MDNLDHKLFEIFEELRRRSVPLGVTDYLLAIKLVQEIADAENLDNIKRLCRLLWAKSHEDQELFDETFEIKLGMAFTTSQSEASERVGETGSKTQPISDSQVSTSVSKGSQMGDHPGSQRKPMRIPRLSLLQRGHPKTGSRQTSTVKYHLLPSLPISRRDMASIWRHLRRPRREGPLEELDVQGTIDSISRTGFFLGPALLPRRRNLAKLTLLIDQGGSMVPFSLLIEALAESILRGGLLGQISIFYFHNYPRAYFYERPTLHGARPVEEILTNYCQNSSVLIVSDAGAARGRYNRGRVLGTKAFLSKLSQYTYLYAWLNPIPESRWAGTTASEIAHLLPVFHLDREGLNDVVNVLRGQPLLPKLSSINE